MDTDTTRYFAMSFPQQLVREPIVFNLGAKFGVAFNILQASVTESHGRLTLSLTAPASQIREAIDYLLARGVEIREVPAPVAAAAAVV